MRLEQFGKKRILRQPTLKWPETGVRDKEEKKKERDERREEIKDAEEVWLKDGREEDNARYREEGGE